MQGSTAVDSDGIVSSDRSPILVGFVPVIVSGTDYFLSTVPVPGVSRTRLQRIHAVCTDPVGSVGGEWELRNNAGSLIMALPQPQLAAGLVVGQALNFEFPTSLSTQQGTALIIRPTSNLGSWKIAAMGYYTSTRAPL